MSYRSGFKSDNAWLSRAFIFIFGLGCMTFALAQPSATESHQALAPNEVVAIKLEQFKVVKDASGREALADAKTVKPGDIVEYRATYTNRDGRPVKGLLATLPIPVGMNYLPKTAKPTSDKLEAATKNGEYAREPLMRQVRVNGKLQAEAVPYTQYRSLRWQIGQLPAGADYVVSARTQVEGLTPTAEKASAPGVTGSSTVKK